MLSDACLSSSWAATSSAPLLTPVDNVHTMQLPDPSDSGSIIVKQKEDKLPHDASVFVGSLPSNMDQGDLTRLLMEHLSEHTQIKNIKVVRDSKGGVCAFVQCENARSATSLIHTLHSSAPKPFLGRILRYEPARAFRSLVISYREPTHYVTSTGTNIQNEIKLDLPVAMRIWKHRNSRFHSISYNLEAIQAAEAYATSTSDATVQDNAFYLHPLKYDENSLRSLASYFGPLESFAPLQPLNTDGDNSQFDMPFDSYPELHRSPRSPSMVTLCWEIKWEHRDDCVSALMTLRRVPHLTVTWAHQPNASGQGLNLPGHRHAFQSYASHNRHRPFVHQTFAAHRVHINRYQQFTVSSGSLDDQVSCISPLLSATHDHDTHKVSYEPCADESSSTATRKDPNSSVMEDGDNNMSIILDQLHLANKTSSVILKSTSEGDLQKRSRTGDQESSSQDAACDASTEDINAIDTDGQDVYVPPTPALDASTITPLTPGSHFPMTPTSAGTDVPCPTMVSDHRDTHILSRENGPGRDIDPTTLFVGGLEMFGPGAWNEEKVKAFFSRFGGLEYVKVVRPMNACAAFAFVKFDNTEAPARAVFEEHNRVYEGRAMRVQLRDCNPPKSNWKYNRGRGGKPHQHHTGVPRRMSYRPPFNSQERSSFPMNKQSSNFIDIDLTSKSQPLPPFHASPAEARPHRDDTSSTCNASELSSLSLDISSSTRNSPPGEKYREWYEEANEAAFSAHTPEPASLGSSTSTTAPPFSTSPSYGYPVASGYFPPPSWVHAYPPHVPYQMPYYPGYPVYPQAAVPPAHVLTSSPGSDVNIPAAGMQNSWPPVGMYTSYIPYSTMPSRTQLLEQGQQTHISAQAPVVPTGFIQNEQGTLIAVYQPEALDQYLAGTVPNVSMSPSGIASNAQRWEYPAPQLLENPTNNAFISQHNRPKSAGFHAPPSQKSNTPPRETDINVNPPLYRRQGPVRRELQPMHGFTGHPSHQRPVNNVRTTRAHVHYPATVLATDLGHHTTRPAISADWNRWNNIR